MIFSHSRKPHKNTSVLVGIFLKVKFACKVNGDSSIAPRRRRAFSSSSVGDVTFDSVPRTTVNETDGIGRK